MTIRLVAQDVDGRDYLIETEGIGGANIVLLKVPCQSSVYVGAAVIMQSSGIAKNALANLLANSNIIGIVESKPSTTECDIRVLGVTVGGIFSGLDVTKEYYLSDTIAGGISTLPPTASGSVIVKLGQPYSSNELLVIKGTRIVRS